jgi:hypothetical protein
MPMLWRRIAWFVSFAIAVVLALWMRSMNYGWPATLGVALITWVALPLVISQACAAFSLRRFRGRMRRADGLADKIAGAVKGLPPQEQVAVAKRMIDEQLRQDSQH